MPKTKPVVMTPKELKLYIQTWYKPFLVYSHVDVIELTPRGVRFGSPDWDGGSNYYEFIQYANGNVGFRYVEWPEDRKNPRLHDIEKAPDINALMMLMLDFVFDPTDKPSGPRNNYRNL